MTAIFKVFLFVIFVSTVSLIIKILKFRKSIFTFSVILCCSLLVFAGAVKMRSYVPDSEYNLEIRWEGIYLDKNYRDISRSINQCYNKKIMKEGVIARSNGWFSGWSCADVGNPESIISLNYNPVKQKKFYCWNTEKDKPVLGNVPNHDIKLDSLETIKSWKNKKMRKAACDAVRQVLLSINQNKKTLIHCDAGRDRTGFIAAILVTVMAEYNGKFDNKIMQAIECDYRKTPSLKKENYGRMKKFISEIRKNTTMTDFIYNQCSIPYHTINMAAVKLTSK